jgi:hypothetical protein
MSRDPDDPRAYDRARDAFDELTPEDQARFLLEMAATGVSRGATSISRSLADELENVFGGGGGSSRSSHSGRRGARSDRDAQSDRDESRTSAADEPRSRSRGGPGPAEPPTDAQRSP